MGTPKNDRARDIFLVILAACWSVGLLAVWIIRAVQAGSWGGLFAVWAAFTLTVGAGVFLIERSRAKQPSLIAASLYQMKLGLIIFSIAVATLGDSLLSPHGDKVYAIGNIVAVLIAAYGCFFIISGFRKRRA